MTLLLATVDAAQAGWTALILALAVVAVGLIAIPQIARERREADERKAAAEAARRAHDAASLQALKQLHDRGRR